MNSKHFWRTGKRVPDLDNDYHDPPETVRIPCAYCGEMFTRSKARHEFAVRHGRKEYCGKGCATKARNKSVDRSNFHVGKSGPEDLKVLLDTFMKLEEYGSFTTTADAMHLCNETATMYRLSSLEKYLGAKLFIRLRGGRRARRLVLTNAGKVLYKKLLAGEYFGTHTTKNGMINER